MLYIPPFGTGRSVGPSLAIRERLAKADRGNAGWQRDLSVSHERIGDVQNMRGETIQAIAAFERALEVYRELQARNPDDIPSRVFCCEYQDLRENPLRQSDQWVTLPV